MKLLSFILCYCLIICLALSCTKNGKDTPVVTPPKDTAVVTPPKDTTSTQPPKDTTSTNQPPKDTSIEATYSYVLQGITSAFLLNDSATGYTYFDMGNLSGTDIQVETDTNAANITVELHASHAMQVKPGGASKQTGTWDNTAEQYDPTKLTWADTSAHPYFKMVLSDKKQIIVGLFTKAGAISLTVGNKVASNELVEQIPRGTRFKAVRIQLY